MSESYIHNREANNTPEITQQQVVEFLRELEPGRQGYDLFVEMARLNVLGSVEMVPLRVSAEGKTQILMTQRPEGDQWAGMWHVPGTIMLATDKVADGHDYSDAFTRIFGDTGELEEGVRLVSPPVYIDSERRKTRRGDELAAVHYAEVVGETALGTYFDADEFPDNVPVPGVIPHQIGFIALAITHFTTNKELG